MDLLKWLFADHSDHQALLQNQEEALRRLNRVLGSVHRLEAAVAVTQEQVDALAASVQEASTRIGDGVTRANTSLDAVRQDVADLKDAHPDVDLTSLEANVAGLSDAVAPLSTLADNLSELDSENPELPPAEPTPEPTDPTAPVEPGAPTDPTAPVDQPPADPTV
jgi:chromosome segregation ATPase